MTDRTPVDKNERLVIGYFANKEQAETAVDALHHWDTSNAAVKLGNIGIMYKDGGKIKTVVPRRGVRALPWAWALAPSPVFYLAA